MLAGEEKPVAPKDVNDFSAAIEGAKVREPEAWRKLEAKLREIENFLAEHWNSQLRRARAYAAGARRSRS